MGVKASFQISESYSNIHPPGTKVCSPEFKTQTALIYSISGQCVFDSCPWFLRQGIMGTTGNHLANTLFT